jgi:hypothetical protein
MLYYLLGGVLAVRDNELDVGDDEVASSDVTESGKLVGKLWDADPVNWPRLAEEGGPQNSLF